MLSRRDLIASGAAFTQARPVVTEAAQRNGSGIDNQALNEIITALHDLRPHAATSIITQVRDRQRGFLRQNQRFPEFIDVGIRVWEQLQDWHVENHQEMKIARAADGRYTMEFMTTQLVLRPDIADTEIGLAYDR
jgi:hypothetical protein